MTDFKPPERTLSEHKSPKRTIGGAVHYTSNKYKGADCDKSNGFQVQVFEKEHPGHGTGVL
jgi:hypothetical protein